MTDEEFWREVERPMKRERDPTDVSWDEEFERDFERLLNEVRSKRNAAEERGKKLSELFAE